MNSFDEYTGTRMDWWRRRDGVFGAFGALSLGLAQREYTVF